MSLLIIKHLRVAFGNKVNILLVIIFLKNDDYYVPSITLLVEKKKHFGNLRGGSLLSLSSSSASE